MTPDNMPGADISSSSPSKAMSHDETMSRIDEIMARILTRLRSYRPQSNPDLVRKAYEYAELKHRGQRRKCGEPYIIHPVEVTEILTEFEMDEQTLSAGLLHDVVEDCGVTLSELEAEFGSEIANLVDGVTKLQISGVDEGKIRDTDPVETAEIS